MAAVSTVVVPDAAALRRAIDDHLARGYTLAAQDDTGATVVDRTEFDSLRAVLLFVLCVVPLLVYLAVHLARQDRTVRLVVAAWEVSPDGRWWWSPSEARWLPVDASTPAGHLAADGRWRWTAAGWQPVPTDAGDVAPSDDSSTGR